MISLLIGAVLPSSLAVGDGILDLTDLANYANQPIPEYINRNNTPPGNQITDRGATLGRVLFYDKRLSKTDTIACGSCHQQAHAFGDPDLASTGVAGTTGRHAMRLVNARFAQEVRFFWDERATSLENQTTQPIQNHVEMGFSGTSGDPAFADLVTKLSAIDEYRVLFTMAFGDSTITETRVQQALAQFVRSIQSFDSKFDAGRALVGNNGANFPNFTASENNGKALFLNPPPDGAGCAGCHRPPEFDIDPASLNNGVITQIGGGTDLTNTRSPSLRDIVGPAGQSNGGLMHDASKATLLDVINHYDRIPGNNGNLDQRLRRPGGGVQVLNLTQQEKNDLVAFLRTLTGSAIYTDARWSDPFDTAGNLSLIVLPVGAITLTNQGNGTAVIATKAAPRLNFLLQMSSDLKTWTTYTTVNSGNTGLCSQTVNVVNSTFFRFAYQPPVQFAVRAASTDQPPFITPKHNSRANRLLINRPNLKASSRR
jgi:cytochrome c peroxidase